MLYFTQNGLTLETDSGTQSWSLPELLETPDPLSGLPLAERNAVLRKAAEMAVYSGLSDPPVPISSDPPIPEV